MVLRGSKPRASTNFATTAKPYDIHNANSVQSPNTFLLQCPYADKETPSTQACARQVQARPKARRAEAGWQLAGQRAQVVRQEPAREGLAEGLTADDHPPPPYRGWHIDRRRISASRRVGRQPYHSIA